MSRVPIGAPSLTALEQTAALELLRNKLFKQAFTMWVDHPMSAVELAWGVFLDALGDAGETVGVRGMNDLTRDFTPYGFERLKAANSDFADIADRLYALTRLYVLIYQGEADPHADGHDFIEAAQALTTLITRRVAATRGQRVPRSVG